MSDNVKFEAELLETAHLSEYVQVMLTRECVSFVTNFAGEWVKNIDMLEEHGFTVDEEGNLICGRKHLKSGVENLGVFTDFVNLMAVGEAINQHNVNCTHLEDAPFGIIEEVDA